MLDTEDQLDAFFEHHGIRGMHWGIRKREVSAEKQARREEKAQKFVKKANVLDTKIKYLSGLNPKTNYARSVVNQRKEDLIRERDIALKDAEAKRKGKLSSTQKKVVIGASVVAALVAAKITYNQIQSGEAHSLVVRGKAFVQGNKGSLWKPNPKLADPNLDAEGIFHRVVPYINPGRGLGSKMNCRRCTYAYEMRRRGLDVIANRSSTGRGADASGVFNVLHPGTKKFVNPGVGGMGTRMLREKFSSEKPFTKFATGGKNIGDKIVLHPTELFNELKQNTPHGSRGEVAIQYRGGGMHSLAFENIRGKPVVFDTQSRKMYKSPEEFMSHFGWSIKQLGFTRLDNVPLNNTFLTRWVKSA